MAAAKEGDFRVLGVTDKETMMIDVGEKERPPGDPPDQQVSWAMRVRGCNGGGAPVPEEVLEDAFVLERLRVEFPDGAGGEPVITVGEEVIEAMNGLWKNCMIVKVLGRSVSVAVLSKRLKEMWSPVSAMHVMDLPRQFFLVRFEREDEYMAALTGGPWRLFGSYLMVKAWSPDFDPLRNDITTTPVWVRVANLPVNMYHKMILMGIAAGLGKPIRVDMTTLRFERARYARVCVEVDLAKPLKGTVMVNGLRYFVSYEGLLKVCSGCGMYGHLIHTCPRKGLNSSVGVTERCVVPASQSQCRSEGPVEMDKEKESFTEVRAGGRRWNSDGRKSVVFSAGGSREVLDHGQRSPVSSANAESSANAGSISTANRFGNLMVTEVVSEDMNEIGMREANKENEAPLMNSQMEKRVIQGNRVVAGDEKGRQRGDGKEGRFEKGSRASKQSERGVYRAKQGKSKPRPMRGLIFGAKLGEVELSPTGKRMRVESRPGMRRAGEEDQCRDTMGRDGGAPVGMEAADDIVADFKGDESPGGDMVRSCSAKGVA